MAETAVPKINPDVSAAGPVDLTRAHFVGIAGTGMLPVARACAQSGFTVSGSDSRSTQGLEELTRLGVDIHVGHASAHVPAGATAVVFTHAVGEDNPEICEARRRGIPLVHRSAVLNALMATRRTPIAVMGTHGKSSTSGMVAFALARMGQEPSYVVGADLDGAGSGGHAGKGGFFVAEVDESDRSHIGVRMRVAVITNIGHDHLQNYAEQTDHVDAYEQCVRLGLHENGTLLLNIDSAGCRELASRFAMTDDGPRVVTFGTSSAAHWRLTERGSEQGRSTAVLLGPDGQEFNLTLRVPGVHQLLNAAAAIGTLHAVGQDYDLAAQQLRYFDGVARRMTPAGEAAGVRVFDSYAHHPDEVRADLAAARSLVVGGGRVVAVFQPSDQARLDAFNVEFGKALAACDEVVLTDSTHGVALTALELLSARVRGEGGYARHVLPGRAEAVRHAAASARPGDVVVLMGSGDLVESGPVLLAVLGRVIAAAA
ncbi:UDP-N-acetylmuramate--L-alanine ligase [Streptomyces sp. BH-SS-21]|uniref:UDP-N-acetylmuramate--L-alanine ligase n=1 Tax=Streptomyces liliiviolaceus TaxID=2823109 RepID=A0A940Y4G9_9ACTN|nr:Mur ligase domain-containing protein [Streptomyces liliiviolaceus]MBQ0855451.1 UDP-N-acetylmuramate--L-alanine ligase [Streptomyces liliiviolaceus]